MGVVTSQNMEAEQWIKIVRKEWKRAAQFVIKSSARSANCRTTNGQRMPKAQANSRARHESISPVREKSANALRRATQAGPILNQGCPKGFDISSFMGYIKRATED